MGASFFLLFAASVIFRCLAAQTARIYESRARKLLPRNVSGNVTRLLLVQYRHRLPEYRARVLPIWASRIGLDALCCGALLLSFWWNPLTFLAVSEQNFLKHSGFGIVGLAASVEALAFGWGALISWWGVPREPERNHAETEE